MDKDKNLETREPAGATALPVESRPRAWRRFLKNPRSLAALGIILFMAALACGADFLAPYNFKAQARGCELLGPGGSFWLGTDFLGRDLLSRLMFGARISLAAGVAATAITLVLGVLVGLLAGFLGGIADTVLMRITDTFAAFPSLLLAVAITALCDRPSLTIVFFALGVVGWTGIARIVRAEVLTVRTHDYVTAARALGARRRRIMFRHVLPNCLAPIIIMATLSVGGNILGEAGLSFLGLGVQDPFPSWGGMLADSRGYFQHYWWTAAFPGLAIVLTVLAFNLLGDGLRDALDPRARK
jgi:peptide/nickel transport system permease protein